MSVWILEKDFRFEAAHRLPRHDGKCARLHGHSFKGTIFIGGNTLMETGPKSGMVIDYGSLSIILKPLLEDYLDHHYLNESLELENPTSEEIARWIYNYLKPSLRILTAVRIQETCTARCVYQP